jgi:hypothetical protein
MSFRLAARYKFWPRYELFESSTRLDFITFFNKPPLVGLINPSKITIGKTFEGTGLLGDITVTTEDIKIQLFYFLIKREEKMYVWSWSGTQSTITAAIY